jgi:hypothetical protein
MNWLAEVAEDGTPPMVCVSFVCTGNAHGRG